MFLIAIVALFGVGYPFARIALGIGLCIYSAALYKNFNVWLIVIPALLPILDLAPWSGRFFLEEFDFFVLLTLAFGLLKYGPQSIGARPLPIPLLVGLCSLGVSYAVGLAIGLLPLQPLDANAFSNYYSHYNSLRMGKGFFEAAALFALFLSSQGAERKNFARFAMGMTIGLIGVTAAVVRERFLFSGLLNFSSDFRVTGTFSGLHNGGNDLEAYIVLAQPFLLASFALNRNLLMRVACVGVFFVSTYALAVTFSRAGLIALILNWFLLGVGLVISLRFRALYPLMRAACAGFLLFAAGLFIVLPILGGTFFKARLEAAKLDLDYRLVQSRVTLGMMRADWQASWAGMGLGRFPEFAYVQDPLKIRPAAYRFEKEADNLFLRLFPGSPLFFGQRIDLGPRQKYFVSIDVRAEKRGALTVHVCEKTLQHSFGCVHQRIEADRGGWTERKIQIDAGDMGSERGAWWLFRRPVEFSISNGSQDTVIDIDNIRLLDAAGRNVIVNGEFSGGFDRWFFTVDNLVPWQGANHWVHVFFEQGWVGVGSQLIFLACVYWLLLAQLWRGHWECALVLASVSSFLSIGLFGFLFDTPRLAMLLFLIALVFTSDRISTRESNGASV